MLDILLILFLLHPPFFYPFNPLIIIYTFSFKKLHFKGEESYSCFETSILGSKVNTMIDMVE